MCVLSTAWLKLTFGTQQYIESLEDYIRVHLMGSKPVMTLMPLKKVAEKLLSGKFKRIHRSYVVRTDRVKSIGNRKVELSSGKELPVGESHAGFIKE